MHTVERVAAAYPSVDVLDKQGFINSKNAQINSLLALIYVMLALAVMIALLGMAKGQLRAAVRWEAALIALFGTALGLSIGVFFGWAMVRALSDQGISRLTVPIGSLTVVTVIAAFAGIGAAILPARRAARLDPLKAIAT